MRSDSWRANDTTDDDDQVSVPEPNALFRAGELVAAARICAPDVTAASVHHII